MGQRTQRKWVRGPLKHGLEDNGKMVEDNGEMG